MKKGRPFPGGPSHVCGHRLLSLYRTFMTTSSVLSASSSHVLEIPAWGSGARRAAPGGYRYFVSVSYQGPKAPSKRPRNAHRSAYNFLGMDARTKTQDMPSKGHFWPFKHYMLKNGGNPRPKHGNLKHPFMLEAQDIGFLGFRIIRP